MNQTTLLLQAFADQDLAPHTNSIKFYNLELRSIRREVTTRLINTILLKMNPHTWLSDIKTAKLMYDMHQITPALKTIIPRKLQTELPKTLLNLPTLYKKPITLSTIRKNQVQIYYSLVYMLYAIDYLDNHNSTIAYNYGLPDVTNQPHHPQSLGITLLAIIRHHLLKHFVDTAKQPSGINAKHNEQTDKSPNDTAENNPITVKNLCQKTFWMCVLFLPQTSAQLIFVTLDTLDWCLGYIAYAISWFVPPYVFGLRSYMYSKQRRHPHLSSTNAVAELNLPESSISQYPQYIQPYIQTAMYIKDDFARLFSVFGQALFYVVAFVPTAIQQTSKSADCIIHNKTTHTLKKNLELATSHKHMFGVTPSLQVHAFSHLGNLIRCQFYESALSTIETIKQFNSTVKSIHHNTLCMWRVSRLATITMPFLWLVGTLDYSILSLPKTIYNRAYNDLYYTLARFTTAVLQYPLSLLCSLDFIMLRRHTTPDIILKYIFDSSFDQRFADKASLQNNKIRTASPSQTVGYYIMNIIGVLYHSIISGFGDQDTPPHRNSNKSLTAIHNRPDCRIIVEGNNTECKCIAIASNRYARTFVADNIEGLFRRDLQPTHQ